MLMLAHDNIKMVARHDLNPHVLTAVFFIDCMCISDEVERVCNLKTLHLTNGINWQNNHGCI